MIITTPLSASHLPPEGEHPTYIDKLIDIGNQFSMYNGHEIHARKLMMSCALFCDERQKNGKPFTVTIFRTASMNVRSSLRKDVEGIRGKMSAAEAATFDTSSLLGCPCFVTIKHVDSGGQLRAVIEKFSPVPDGFVMPEMTEKLISFDLENPDATVFMNLSAGIKKMIESSPEWKQHPTSKDWIKQVLDSKNLAAVGCQ